MRLFALALLFAPLPALADSVDVRVLIYHAETHPQTGEPCGGEFSGPSQNLDLFFDNIEFNARDEQERWPERAFPRLGVGDGGALDVRLDWSPGNIALGVPPGLQSTYVVRIGWSDRDVLRTDRNLSVGPYQIVGPQRLYVTRNGWSTVNPGNDYARHGVIVCNRPPAVITTSNVFEDLEPGSVFIGWRHEGGLGQARDWRQARVFLGPDPAPDNLVYTQVPWGFTNTTVRDLDCGQYFVCYENEDEYGHVTTNCDASIEVERCAPEVDAEVDAAVDAELDAEVDAVIDAEVDAEIDAEVDADLDAEIDVQEVDAQIPDAQAVDAQIPDVQAVDAQIPDVQAVDVQIPDAQIPDAQPVDAQIPDVQIPDAQPVDAQIPDAQIPDVQAVDAQIPDVQAVDVQIPDVPIPDVQPVDVQPMDASTPDLGPPPDLGMTMLDLGLSDGPLAPDARRRDGDPDPPPLPDAAPDAPRPDAARPDMRPDSGKVSDAAADARLVDAADAIVGGEPADDGDEPSGCRSTPAPGLVWMVVLLGAARRRAWRRAG